MTRVWGHRGASHDAPENTIPAFQLAADYGADGIELDVQRTSDGVLVVCHDERVKRTSTGRGRISKHTYAELSKFDYSYRHPEVGPVRLPTLDEVLDVVATRGLFCNIELKNSVVRYKGMEEQAVAAVANAGLADRVLYSSFNHRSVRMLATMGVPAGVLFGDVLAEPESYARVLGAVALHPGANVLRMDKHLIERAHEAGLAVNVWTVDNRRALERVIDLGVDAVITNRPDVAVEVRDHEPGE